MSDTDAAMPRLSLLEYFQPNSRPQNEITREIQDRIRAILPDPVPLGTEDATSTFPAITDA